MPWLKAVEVLGLLLALAAFVAWQWWDLKQAKADSTRRRLAAKDAEVNSPPDSPKEQEPTSTP